MRTLRRMWSDDGGALLALEWVFIATILVLGAVTGLTVLRNAFNQQAAATAGSILSLDPSFVISGQQNRESATTPSGQGSQLDIFIHQGERRDHHRRGLHGFRRDFDFFGDGPCD